MSATAAQIEKILKQLGNAEIAEHSQRFFKTGKGEYGHGDVFLGIRVPVIRAQAKLVHPLGLRQTTALLHSKYHEIRLFALLALVDLYQKGDDKTKASVYKLYLENTRYINNWDLVDLSAHKIVGYHLTDRCRAVLYRLAESGNLWERRIAVISTFHFIHHCDFADSLGLAGLLCDDKEDLIHKAVGWMLREIGNRNRAVEEKFLRKHYSRMPRTMLRYAIERFPEPLRQGYLTGSI